MSRMSNQMWEIIPTAKQPKIVDSLEEHLNRNWYRLVQSGRKDDVLRLFSTYVDIMDVLNDWEYAGELPSAGGFNDWERVIAQGLCSFQRIPDDVVYRCEDDHTDMKGDDIPIPSWEGGESK